MMKKIFILTTLCMALGMTSQPTTCLADPFSITFTGAVTASSYMYPSDTNSIMIGDAFEVAAAFDTDSPWIEAGGTKQEDYVESMDLRIWNEGSGAKK